MNHTDVEHRPTAKRPLSRMVVAAVVTGAVLALLNYFVRDETALRSTIAGAVVAALMVITHVVDQRWEHRRRQR
ncbi:hypothetical protein [Kineococcus auxinigenes]|uniref:hypothetical protein n=1 Tax=unclassified Kineococcus TaxID=2621656 RepID=UPI003D7CCA19